MKKIIIPFFQSIVLLIGVLALFLLILFPQTEGRAANLDLFHIYADPLILYGYAASIPFFVALYNGFKLLGFIGQNNFFSSNSLRALKTIKYCAILLSILILIAGIYVKLFHSKDDDPAGFMAMCIVTIFLSSAIAFTAGKYENRCRKSLS